MALVGRVELDEAIDITLLVAGGLAASNAAGILHRDVNRKNIDPAGRVHEVFNFGLPSFATVS